MTEPATPASEAPATAAPAAPAEPPASAAQEQAPAGNDAAALSRIQAERDSLRSQVADLSKRLDAAKTLEDIEAAKKQASDEAQAAYEAKMLDLGIEVALTKAGCINTRAAKALVDVSSLSLDGDGVKGLDVAALAKEAPYLFQAPRTVATGTPPAGPPADKDAALTAVMRDTMGLKPID
jgi:uncharacterized protein YPO0396